MATLVSSANGNWATASTWGVVDTTSLSADNTSNVTISTSYITTAAFTPGAIEINAIAVKMYRRLKTTGTFTVELYDNTAAAVVSGTTVTIDMADVPEDDYNATTVVTSVGERGGWLVMRFGTDIYTNVTLVAGHSYSVRAICSDTSAIGLYRNATANNFDRMLITTTTATPVAADRLIIAGYHTGQGAMTDITVDYNSNSATDYGQITVEDQGIFNFLSDQTTIALKTSGNLVIHGGGSLICGTTVSPIPDTTTITITMDCASAIQYGIIGLNGSYVTFHGQERNYVYTKLNGDANSGATTINTVDSTGWKNGDIVLFTSTLNVANNAYLEQRTLNANASGGSFTISSGLTYSAHQGGTTNPDICGHVVNLTRNIKIFGVNTTNTTYTHFRPSCTVDMRWVEFQYYGSGTADKYSAIYSNSYLLNYFKGISCYNCSTTSGVASIYTGTGATNVTIDSCVTHQLTGNTSYGIIIGDNTTTQSNITVTNSIAVGGRYGFYIICFNDVTVTNCVSANQFVYASGSFGFWIYGRTYANPDTFTFSNLEAYCTYNSQMVIQGYNPIGTWQNIKLWRTVVSTATQMAFGWNSITAAYNNAIYANRALVIDGLKILDCPTAIQIPNTLWNDMVIIDGYFGNSGVTGGNSTSYSIYIGNNYYVTGNTKFINCNFADASVANVFNYAMQANLQFENCLFGGSVELINQLYHPPSSYSYSMNHDQIAGNHLRWSRRGTLSTDTSIYSTTSPSMRMTPISTGGAGEKLQAFIKKIAVNSGDTPTVTVKVRTSVVGDGAAYDGNRARLILIGNYTLGTELDTVIATATSSSDGAWETLSATLPSASTDGVWELMVDCDGTTGWINVDDWTVSVNNDPRTSKYWSEGEPYLGAEYTTGGGGGGASGGAWTFA